MYSWDRYSAPSGQLGAGGGVQLYMVQRSEEHHGRPHGGGGGYFWCYLLQTNWHISKLGSHSQDHCVMARW
jgi:hypothetical protein